MSTSGELEGVAYQEVKAGIRESGNANSIEVTRVYEVKGDRKWPFAEAAMGYARTEESGSPNALIVRRKLPWECPYRPGLYAKSFSFENKGQHYSDGTFKLCHVSITFSSPEFQDWQGDDGRLSGDPENADPGSTGTEGSIALYSIVASEEAELRQTIAPYLRYDRDLKDVGEEQKRIAKYWPVQGYELTLHRVPFYPRGFLRGITGHCNYYEFKIGREVFPSETLLLKGWSAQREATFSGGFLQIPCWTVRLSLLECAYGFNSVFRHDDGELDKVFPGDAIVPWSEDFHRLLWLCK